MKPDEIDVPAYVDAASKLIGLPLDPAHRAGVIANMQRNAQMAAVVFGAPEPVDGDQAPVYVP
jgi:hypothetical protein